MNHNKPLAIVAGAGPGLGQALVAQYGSPKLIIHNPAHLVISPFSETF